MKPGFFHDKVAIVTGSSMGIGRTTALELAKAGARVVLNARNADRLEATRKWLTGLGHSVVAIQADVTKYEECEKLINETLLAFGRIDILINNAGVTMNERFENIHHEIFRQVVESNIIGSAFPSKAALPHILKSKGSIVFISSLAGMSGMPTGSGYSAGKMALTALAESMHIEMINKPVHIGIVYVSFTENDPEKKGYTADGSLAPLPERPAYLKQTQQQVATAIMNNIRRRRFKSVLSFLGKLNAFMLRFFPRVARAIIIRSQKSASK